VEELLNAEEVALILKVARVTPYQWAKRGVFAHYKIQGYSALRWKILKPLWNPKGWIKKACKSLKVTNPQPSVVDQIEYYEINKKGRAQFQPCLS